MALVRAVHEATPFEALMVGIALTSAGVLLLIFRKRVQAFNLTLMNRRPEGKFLYVTTYIYGPLILIMFGLIVFLTGLLHP